MSAFTAPFDISAAPARTSTTLLDRLVRRNAVFFAAFAGVSAAALTVSQEDVR